MVSPQIIKIQKDIDPFLHDSGYRHHETDVMGFLYLHQTKSICLKIDVNICQLSTYAYVDYTGIQNQLVHEYDVFLRFSIDSSDEIQRLMDELEFFTSPAPEPEKLKRYGANRQEQEIDPSLPEATFEECFSQAFGEKSLYALTRESEYYDYEGKRRFIDYLLDTSEGNFAIELNGEKFHHPAAIKEKRYASQLFKQNSLAAEGIKVFRWSQRGMADREKFIQELRHFFGDPTCFNSMPHFKALRSLHTFMLAEHQLDSLNYIESLRREGQNAFIIVLPTAAGKTEIFIEDFYQQKQRAPGIKALVLVPRKGLKQQTVLRFNDRQPELIVNETFYPLEDNDVCVQTYAYLTRHYHERPRDAFDYIVVDEAHHAQASGLKKILGYYKPSNLLGFTATDQRLDQRRLEDIFGEYETRMTLKEAIEKEIVPPISVYRLKTSIDLSEVRFNGKDFVKSDLQKTIQVPSRDEMIVNLVKKAFFQPLLAGQSAKQGLVFCVDIKHAKRIAKLFNENGISASAVSGQERRQSEQALDDYAKGNIQFLCACDLLNEGWDSPQTSILVMARPTMSKVLYTQQLGRGTRDHKNKERLYVIDVVDSYGAKLQPWSAHALLNISEYMPFSDVLGSKASDLNHELLVLSGLFEHEMRLEPIDLFTMEQNYSDMLNEEQLARELFVSTGTVRQWLKKGEISADASLPFGRRTLSFFTVESVENIRHIKGLKKHTEKTRKEDFFTLLQERDYTFSYKIIFLCLMFKLSNERGEVDLPDLTKKYSDFYLDLLERYNKADKELSPLNRKEILLDTDEIQKSILRNPFEKFERKRFMIHCKDLNYISFDVVLWEKLNPGDKEKVQQQMYEDLKHYYEKLNILLSHENYMKLEFINRSVQKFLTEEPVEKEIPEFQNLFIQEPDDKNKYVTSLPYYPLEIAAGGYAESHINNDPEQWVDLNQAGVFRTLDKGMFVSQIHGHSMEPLIQDGSYCLFKYGVAGSRNGKVVLVQKSGYEDPDTRASFTIKRYHSQKVADSEFGWQHEKIELRPENPEYPVLSIEADDADNFHVIAEFLQVIE